MLTLRAAESRDRRPGDTTGMGLDARLLPQGSSPVKLDENLRGGRPRPGFPERKHRNPYGYGDRRTSLGVDSCLVIVNTHLRVADVNGNMTRHIASWRRFDVLLRCAHNRRRHRASGGAMAKWARRPPKSHRCFTGFS